MTEHCPLASRGSNADAFIGLTESPRGRSLWPHTPRTPWALPSVSPALMPTGPVFAHWMVPTGCVPSLRYLFSLFLQLYNFSEPPFKFMDSTQVYCQASLIKFHFGHILQILSLYLVLFSYIYIYMNIFPIYIIYNFPSIYMYVCMYSLCGKTWFLPNREWIWLLYSFLN